MLLYPDKSRSIPPSRCRTGATARSWRPAQPAIWSVLSGRLSLRNPAKGSRSPAVLHAKYALVGPAVTGNPSTAKSSQYRVGSRST